MKKNYNIIIYKGEELNWNGLVRENENYTIDEYTIDQLIENLDKDVLYYNYDRG